ncbi:two-component regulator propeller domain-containing protein [Pedobacter aquatilis]|uniref:ligand-binding sensor domain-containing protein n=1 Tax=Pedobacter aquatilis TaxID=351343 RepID=UPI0025B281F9|nr:sensor histidine kinase [Pedobacter aquatilis]MDN3586637.1 two-component regulator propeller domain-containing protein [Pedobacter aquatilis]
MPQSQVSVIYQAKNRTLWLGTFGGVSNFDGKTFTSYSKADGLISNSITSIVEAVGGQIYIGTEFGLNVLSDGKIKTILSNSYISQLKKDKNGIVWGLSNRKLFQIVKGKPIFSDLKNAHLTCLAVDKKGDLFAFVWEKGIYKRESTGWKLFQKFPADIASTFVSKIIFDESDPNKIYVLSSKLGVYSLTKKQLNRIFIHNNSSNYYTIAQDGKGGLWVGTDRGVYLLNKNKTTIYFNDTNGLSDNRVHDVFKDEENNMWISCFSDGLYKYEGDAFIRYVTFKGQNLNFPISSLAADKKDNLWMGSITKGLLMYDGTKIEPVSNPELRNRNILFTYTDRSKNIWISAQDKGLWKYDGSKFSQELKPGTSDFHSMLQDNNGAYWINNSMQTLYIKDGKTELIEGFSGYNSCIYALDGDSVFLGTSTGVFLLKNKKVDKHFKIKELDGVYVLNITKQNNKILFATLGDGIVSWNPKTKAVEKYTVGSGLNSNDVYSMAPDSNNFLWIGTGRGINKLFFNKKTDKYEVLVNSPLVIECNQGAIINYKSSMVIGTVNGLIRCQTNTNSTTKIGPHIFVDFIKVFHKNDKKKDIYITPEIIKGNPQTLTYNQNHLSISFKAIYLSNPDNVLYSYKMIGVDADYSSPISSNEIEYSSIKPGNYTFEVYAIAGGKPSNIERFSFTIVPPIYDTILFKIFAFIALILLIWFIFFLIFKAKERKKLQLERIKIEEHEKIRRQTAEDFHDDIGNKLTRINVLSEILDKKVDDKQTDQKELIRLIRENTGQLYTGTKDILWALDPKSDNLHSILIHIKNFGVDLFQNTGITFMMEGIVLEYENIGLSMEFNRNVTLIFKEMLNNILKHAKAQNVVVLVITNNQNNIEILTTDDGIGFNLQQVKDGRGLNNIITRANRINSTFKITSEPGQGTNILISTDITVTNF